MTDTTHEAVQPALVSDFTKLEAVKSRSILGQHDGTLPDDLVHDGTLPDDLVQAAGKK